MPAGNPDLPNHWLRALALTPIWSPLSQPPAATARLARAENQNTFVEIALIGRIPFCVAIATVTTPPAATQSLLVPRLSSVLRAPGDPHPGGPAPVEEGMSGEARRAGAARRERGDAHAGVERRLL